MLALTASELTAPAFGFSKTLGSVPACAVLLASLVVISDQPSDGPLSGSPAPSVDTEEFGGRLEAEARDLAAASTTRYTLRELPSHPQAQDSVNHPRSANTSPVQQRPVMANLTAEQFAQLLQAQREDARLAREESKLHRQAIEAQNNLLQAQVDATDRQTTAVHTGSAVRT